MIEVGIIISAFTLQLLALPGEKGQFVISALATKYNPIGVVIGATLAFGSWTVLEIWIGSEIQRYAPEDIIEWFTIVLLVIFALLILYDVRSQTMNRQRIENNKIYQQISESIPDRIEGGVMSFIMMCIGEVGDKTQIITISLASQYGQKPEIWVGEMLAIIPITLLNAYTVSKFSKKYNTNITNYVAVLILILFAIDMTVNQVFGYSILLI